MAERNTAFDDRQPNVRVNGLEVVFASVRDGGEGALDIWRATRESTDDPWNVPVNLGPGNNASGAEIYVSTR